MERYPVVIKRVDPKYKLRDVVFYDNDAYEVTGFRRSTEYDSEASSTDRHDRSTRIEVWRYHLSSKTRIDETLTDVRESLIQECEDDLRGFIERLEAMLAEAKSRLSSIDLQSKLKAAKKPASRRKK